MHRPHDKLRAPPQGQQTAREPAPARTRSVPTMTIESTRAQYPLTTIRGRIKFAAEPQLVPRKSLVGSDDGSPGPT